MHETSLAESIAEILSEEARKADAREVRAVRLRLGALSHVDERALLFCLDVAMRGGPAEGARIEIDRPPGEAWCIDCAQTVAIDRRGDACPLCKGHRLLVTGGDDLQVSELEVA